jgi:putative ATP-dependent endonuclease of OLD family
MVGSRLAFGGFADDEGTDPGRWSAVHTALGPLLFRWPAGCLEENIIRLVPEDRIEDLIKDPSDELTGERLRTLAIRLGIAKKDLASIKANAPDLIGLLIQAATGTVPDDKRDADKGEKKALKRHAERWFKSHEGGIELADKVFTLGLWPALEPLLLPFLNAVRGTLSLVPLTSLPP